MKLSSNIVLEKYVIGHTFIEEITSGPKFDDIFHETIEHLTGRLWLFLNVGGEIQK